MAVPLHRPLHVTLVWVVVTVGGGYTVIVEVVVEVHGPGPVTVWVIV